MVTGYTLAAKMDGSGESTTMEGRVKHKNRITLNDTVEDVVIKMGEGNPGAIRVLCGMLNEGMAIDPKGSPILKILHLDNMGIYGSRIWQLYKGVCGESMVNMVALLRGVQLGIVSQNVMWDKNRDFSGLISMIRERMPFNEACGESDEMLSKR